jgi:sugar phosphate isomerase/epimerase
MNDHLAAVTGRGLHLETQVTWRELERFPADVMERLLALRRGGTKITIHAPFVDMSPGGDDIAMRQATLRRLEQTAELADRLSATAIVVHPGWDRPRYRNDDDGYVERAADTWRRFVAATAPGGALVALENIFETTPELLRRVIDAVDHPRFGHCFDVGHYNLFAKEVGVERWLAVMGDKLFELHLHNNDGTDDQHRGMASGTFDFDRLFAALDRRRPTPILTMEPHDPSGIDESLAVLRRHRLASSEEALAG